ncbi:LPD29 domain-containing protein [Chryseobacterium defluvii]|uniref:Large polyvalent protein associated domain-containing protein n=1 Tax=Chryseobacterium defluvii TaxID=160396 RepID=A0A495SM04_9FLAO|nr:LPD29 domain-containing protein [Chryseobacterium defluvii]RKT01077.1 hypothetical protein BCF58_0288 [Chryseobacterium defluvii]
MAYISTEQVKEFRNRIKEVFPAKLGWKISLFREHYTGVYVKILEAPIKLTEKNYEQINEYYIDFNKNLSSGIVFNMIKEICNKGNHNNSDSMTDYFDVGWYFSLSVGSWDKAFKLSEKNIAA